MYGRITENGALEIFSSRILISGTRKIINPKEKDLLANGYKPLTEGKQPTLSDGEVLSIEYVDMGDRIETVYRAVGELK